MMLVIAPIELCAEGPDDVTSGTAPRIEPWWDFEKRS